MGITAYFRIGETQFVGVMGIMWNKLKKFKWGDIPILGSIIAVDEGLQDLQAALDDPLIQKWSQKPMIKKSSQPIIPESKAEKALGKVEQALAPEFKGDPRPIQFIAAMERYCHQ